jgi:hypothetical protein
MHFLSNKLKREIYTKPLNSLLYQQLGCIPCSLCPLPNSIKNVLLYLIEIYFKFKFKLKDFHIPLINFVIKVLLNI